ncbi:hypothetical protein RSAG8_03332, partial [Rhizoctonia solani AG-8 WAC10335]
MTNLTRRRSLMGYILRPIAWQLALASRLAAPSSNKLITSVKSSHCTQSRFIMDFHSDEGRKEVQEWYKYQGVNTRFTLLEYRKIKDGRVKHEFIVVRLNRNTICRFDRRPHDGERGYVLRDGGASAEDSAHVLSSFETEYKELMQQTEVLLTIKLPRGEDLGFILTVCEGIQTHAKASVYSLMRYNCYFFSWMIVAAVARSTYNWETVVLSKAGWDDILRTSLTRIFPTSDQSRGELKTTLPQRAGMRRWLAIVSKPYLRSKVSNSATPFDIESFRDALISAYSNSHDSIQRIMRMLLLRSQLGFALKKELRCVELSGLLSARLAASRKRTISQLDLEFQAKSYPPLQKPLYNASHAAAKMLMQEPPAESTNNNSWEEAWKNAWPESRRRIAPATIYNLSPEARERAMKEWKSSWDEINGQSAHYATVFTETITTIMMDQLTDMDLEHLVFGDNIQYHSGSGQPKGHSSLQGFIRSRMQDHFEMVDRFGFGSFQELITTAEVAMCEIWVASLDIMDSGHFHPQCAGASHFTA